jgi:hypothetical protein
VIDAVRDLLNAPGAAVVEPELADAAALAVASAQTLLQLRGPVDVVWCVRQGGYRGQTFGFPDGRVEIKLNVAVKMSPREVVAVALHELKHAADHQRRLLVGMSDEEAEHRANEFSNWAIREVLR